MKDSFFQKRYAFVALYVVIVILTALVGLSFITIYFANNSDALNQENYDKYYVIITDDNKSSFWQSVYEGAYSYGLEQNVYVEDLASTFADDISTEELMRIAIAANVDGIIVSADDSEEMTALIDEAVIKHIPVVTLYNDSPNSRRVSYVGVGNYNIGREYGRQALNVAHDIYDEQQPDVINVVLLVDMVPTSDQMMIYSAVQEAFDVDSLQGRLNLSTVKIDSTNTFSAEENIRDLFISEEVPDIIICLSELNTTCVYQAVIDYNKVGQVNILGYYYSDVILQGIDRDIISSTIRVDTTEMGECCVDALVGFGNNGFTNSYFTVDIEVINRYNVNSYLEVNGDEN